MTDLSTTTPASCHLWVIQASAAPIAVIFRRGPTRQVQLILWRTSTDIFREGQWFNGRVNGTTACLSPKGDLLVYGARKVTGRTRAETQIGGVGDLWTAISRPPFFTALALWSHPGFCRGGGYFETGRRLVLDESKGLSRLKVGTVPAGLQVSHDDDGRVQQLPKLPGWQPVSAETFGGSDHHGKWRCQLKHSRRTEILLRNAKLEHGAYTAATYGLLRGDELIDLGLADWAGFLRDGRLALSRGGQLFASTLLDDAFRIELLADFTQSQFKPMVAPASARKWPPLRC